MRSQSGKEDPDKSWNGLVDIIHSGETRVLSKMSSILNMVLRHHDLANHCLGRPTTTMWKNGVCVVVSAV